MKMGKIPTDGKFWWSFPLLTHFPIYKEKVLVNTLVTLVHCEWRQTWLTCWSSDLWVLYQCYYLTRAPQQQWGWSQPRVPGPRSPTSRYFLHTKEDNLLCLDWKIDNLGRWLTAPALRRGIYTFARIHSHTIGRIEYGLRMEWKWLNICKRSFANCSAYIEMTKTRYLQLG